MIIDPHHISQILIHTAQAAAEAPASEGSGGVIGTLGLNWKLFAAQLVNFGILLFVLWKFAFNPIAKKLEARTSKIEKSLQDADRIEKEKQEFETWKNEQITKARQEASGVITAAQTEAGKVRQQLTEQTKADQEKIIQQAKDQIEAEKNKALSAAKSEIAGLVTAATEKILRKKLDAKADQEYIKDSLTNLK